MYMSIRNTIMLSLGINPSSIRAKAENEARNMVEDFLGPMFYKIAKENPEARYFEIVFYTPRKNGLGIYYVCNAGNTSLKNLKKNFDFNYSYDVLEAALMVAPKYDIKVSDYDANAFEHVFTFTIDIRERA